MPADRPSGAPALPLTPDEFATLAHVSRETLARLKLYASMLEDWGARQNLISRASFADLWRRHFWDSAQLIPLIPDEAKSLADLGSGAGFPGLVLAECLRARNLKVALFEATAKKCRFLEAVAERLGLPVEVRQTRIEDAPKQAFDVITARAVAPLPELLSYVRRVSGPRTIALLSKGQNVEAELTEAHKSWTMRVKMHVSLSDSAGRILEVRELRSASRP